MSESSAELPPPIKQVSTPPKQETIRDSSENLVGPIEEIQKGKHFLKALVDDFKEVSERLKTREQERLNQPIDPLERLMYKTKHEFFKKQNLIMMGLWFGEVIREEGTGNSYLGRDVTPLAGIQNLPGLEHLGNLGESYLAANLTYYGLSLINVPFKEKIPDKVKVAVSFLAASAFFTATELGYIRAGTPDIADIPAGIIGPLIFSGVMLLNRKFIEDCGRAIKDLKKRIRQDKIAVKDSAVSSESVQPAVSPAVVPNSSEKPTV